MCRALLRDFPCPDVECVLGEFEEGGCCSYRIVNLLHGVGMFVWACLISVSTVAFGLGAAGTGDAGLVHDASPVTLLTKKGLPVAGSRCSVQLGGSPGAGAGGPGLFQADSPVTVLT